MYRQAQLKEDLPHTHMQGEKIIIEVYGEQTRFLDRPWIRRGTIRRLPSPCSAENGVPGVLREEALRKVKIFSPLFICKALHLRRVWVDITACKLTTTCVRHWSPKIYNFPIVSVQHCSTCFPKKPQTARCRRPALVNYFRVKSVSNNCDLVTKPR